MKYIRNVLTFMKVMGQGLPSKPTIPHADIIALRDSLIEEEAIELSDAANAGDIVEVADALCDLRYVVEGAFLAYGFSPELADELFEEVQRSNMSKTCATLVEAENSVAMLYQTQTQAGVSHGEQFGYRQVEDRWIVYRVSDKKVLKGIGYSKPDLKTILERHGVKC